MLSSSSAFGIVLGLVAAKLTAVWLGPGGVGYMGLLGSLLGIVGVIASMGVSIGLVRFGANALAIGDDDRVAATRVAATLVLGACGLIATAIMVIFREPISEWALGSRSHATAVILMGVALFVRLALGLESSTLNAYHRVGALARAAVWSGLITTPISLAIIWQWRSKGIAASILVTAVIPWAVYLAIRRKEVGHSPKSVDWEKVVQAARTLLSFGVPFTASQVVSTGVQLALPVLVLHVAGAANVGYYRAAATIAVGYVGVLLTAMAQDYYPRVAAASHEPVTLVKLINEQQQLILLLAMPLILGMLALLPILVPILYTAQFSPAVEILEWQLIADILKFSSWTMSYVVMARIGGLTFFFTESVAGLATVGTGYLGLRYFGLSGLGASFLATYGLYFALVYVIVRRSTGLTWTRENKLLLGVGLTAALAVRALPFIGLAEFRTPVALLLAALAGAWSLYTIHRQLGGLHKLRARFLAR